MAEWTDFGSGFEDGDAAQLEHTLFATGEDAVFEESKTDPLAFEAVAAASVLHPLPPPQPAAAAAAEADAVRRMASGDVVTLEGCYELLKRLSRPGEPPFPPVCSVRARASPFAAFGQDHDAFFVARERAPPIIGPPPAETVSVAFQSPLNGEVRWDPNDLSHGVCARPMARRYRSGELAGRMHGYRGRQYTLVVRCLPDGPAAADRAAQCSLVQIWKEANAPENDLRPRKSRKRTKKDEDEQGSDAGSATTGTGSGDEGSPPWPAQQLSCSSSGGWSVEGSVPGNSPAAPPRTLSPPHALFPTSNDGGRVVAEDVRFLGSIQVQGSIHGTLVTPPGAADYGEWFPWHSSVVGTPPPGTVVRLSSRCLWLDTSWGSGPCLITSTSPSLAAGVPVNNAKGVTCAFLGQVPVRCRGPVRAGDALVPSDLNDGVAVGRRGSAGDSLGTALESGDSPHDGECVILCLVRWRDRPPPVSTKPRIVWCLAVAAMFLGRPNIAFLLLCLATWPF